MIQLFYDSYGRFESASLDGQPIPFYPLSPRLTKFNHPLTIAFLEAVDRGEVDLSDRELVLAGSDPDWDRFYESNKLFLLSLVQFSANQPIATALMIEFGKRPNINLSSLIDYWNGSIPPILDSSSILRLNLAIQDCALPVVLIESGVMIGI